MPRLESANWRSAVAAAMADGYTEFVTLMAVEAEGLELWLRLRRSDGTDIVLTTAANGDVDSLVMLLPQAAWYEREAAETFGVGFLGHHTAPLLLPAGSGPTMRRAALLDARHDTPWPGEKEPGGLTARRRQLPPGVRS